MLSTDVTGAAKLVGATDERLASSDPVHNVGAVLQTTDHAGALLVTKPCSQPAMADERNTRVSSPRGTRAWPCMCEGFDFAAYVQTKDKSAGPKRVST